jgi:hypothetical protein
MKSLLIKFYCIKAFRRVANVIQAIVIKQNSLNYKRCNGFGQFTSPLHYPQTKWDNFCREKKCYDFWVVYFDQSSNHTQSSQSQIFKRFIFVYSVQKRIEKNGNLSCKESWSGLWMCSNTLKKSQYIAYSIRGSKIQHRRCKKRVSVYYILQSMLQIFTNKKLSLKNTICK